jgi:hypothetical protein
MTSRSLGSQWLGRAAALVTLAAVLGMGTPAPADEVQICATTSLCQATDLSLPSGTGETACGTGSPGVQARKTIYGSGIRALIHRVSGESVYVCDQQRGYEVGVYPGYVVVGTDDVYVAVYP